MKAAEAIDILEAVAEAKRRAARLPKGDYAGQLADLLEQELARRGLRLERAVVMPRDPDA